MAAEVPRPDLETALLSRALAGPPLLLTGPPGAGKTRLLTGLAARLSRKGAVPVYLDLFAAASSPDRFVTAMLGAIPASGLGQRLAQATEIRALAAAGRAKSEAAVSALFRLLSALDEASGRAVVLLFDDATEIRSLAYFPGLREVHVPFAAALAKRRRGTILATSFPTAARGLFGFEALAARPFTASDLQPFAGEAAASLARASFGWPRYVAILQDAIRHGDDVASAWAREMAPGGGLERACRHTHETLLLRSRGYGISKAALAAVAHEEGLNLTALVERLGRTPGAVRDYLQWLVGVDAIRMTKKKYFYVDGLLRLWVRLHGRGTPPTEAELRAAAAELVSDAGATPEPAGEAEPETPAPARPRRQGDALIEID
jgi:AAA ATPase domain